MNAEVTAENRPACEPNQHVIDMRNVETHEDQGGVQVFIIFLDELSVVLLCFAMIHLVELSSVILLGWWCVLLVTVRGFNAE